MGIIQIAQNNDIEPRSNFSRVNNSKERGFQYEMFELRLHK